MNYDPDQQYIPRLDLTWLAYAVNEAADARSEIKHLAHCSRLDDFPELTRALETAAGAIIAAEVVALRLARKHGVTRGIVGDVVRDALAEVAS